MSQLLLVTLPKKGTSLATIAGEIESERCRVSKFEIPALVVGTLDSLLGLSDDLVKISSQVENVVKKVERQYAEINATNPAEAKPLRVNEVAIEAYFSKFSWDLAQYQTQGKQLSELVGQIQGMAGKNEEELKMLAASYQEKTVALAAAKRRKVVNLATSDFEDFLSPEKAAKVEMLKNDFFHTLTVVVPKALEKEFLQTYHTIGNTIASYGGPDWTKNSSVGQNDGNFGPSINRDKVKGSPVVPGSAKPLVEEGETAMYVVTVLKGHTKAGIVVDDVFTPGETVDYLEPVKAAFREKRYVVREFQYDATKAGGIDAAIQQAKNELKQVRATTYRWCRAHFGEVYVGWVHLKLIQAFVESVLLYGLPAVFVSFFAAHDAKNEKELKAKLTRAVLNARPELRPRVREVVKGAKEEEEEEEGDNGESSLPYVCLKFPMVGVAGAP